MKLVAVNSSSGSEPAHTSSNRESIDEVRRRRRNERERERKDRRKKKTEQTRVNSPMMLHMLNSWEEKWTTFGERIVRCRCFRALSFYVWLAKRIDNKLNLVFPDWQRSIGKKDELVFFFLSLLLVAARTLKTRPHLIIRSKSSRSRSPSFFQSHFIFKWKPPARWPLWRKFRRSIRGKRNDQSRLSRSVRYDKNKSDDVHDDDDYHQGLKQTSEQGSIAMYIVYVTMWRLAK